MRRLIADLFPDLRILEARIAEVTSQSEANGTPTNVRGA